jgi:hypothetical protein
MVRVWVMLAQVKKTETMKSTEMRNGDQIALAGDQTFDQGEGSRPS